MLRFMSFGIGKEFRSMPTIEHTVVAHDANTPVAQHLRAKRLPRHPSACRVCVLPENEQRKLTRIVDAGAHVAVDQTLTRCIEAEASNHFYPA